MEKRGSGFAVGVAAFALGFNAFNIGRIIGEHLADVDGKAEDAQIYNAQLQTELVQSFDEVEDLVVKVEDKTFVFEDGEQHCTGDYKVTDRVAAVAGDIACTVLVQTGEN